MSSRLERLIALARRTGDRLIVHDPAANDDIVIMGLSEYEQLLSVADEFCDSEDQEDFCLPTEFSPTETVESLMEESSDTEFVPDERVSMPEPSASEADQDWLAAQRQLEEINQEIAYLREQLAAKQTALAEEIIEEEVLSEQSTSVHPEYVPVEQPEEMEMPADELPVEIRVADPVSEEDESLTIGEGEVTNEEKIRPAILPRAEWHSAGDLLLEKFASLRQAQDGQGVPPSSLLWQDEEQKRTRVAPYKGEYIHDRGDDADPVFLEEPIS